MSFYKNRTISSNSINESSDCGNCEKIGFKGLSVEEVYGFNPELGLTRSEKLSCDPAYKDFFRDPKIMEAFTEHFDLKDPMTRKAVIHMNEADQTSVLTALTSKLYDNIVSKVDDIDYGDIPNTKGDIDKLSNISKLTECIDLLRNILKEFKQDTSPVEEISVALSNVRSRKTLFERAFRMDVELPIIVYNNITLSIIESVSFMIASSIEFMKTPNRDSFQVTLDKVAYAKTKNNLLYKNLKKFNNSCKSGEFDKAIEHVLKNRVNHISEGAVSVAAGITVVGAALLIILNIIPILREIVFFFYYTRMRVSDFFDIQADLLQMNAHNLESSLSHDEKQKERIISKQLKIVELFRKIANKISFTGRKAEVETEKEIANSSTKMKINDISGSELPDSVSALF